MFDRRPAPAWLVLVGIILIPGSLLAGEATPPAPSPDEQVASMEAMCAEASESIAARQAETSLYERLGGEEKIRAIVEDVVRLHGINPDIKDYLEGVDQDHLVASVTQFLVVATGGPGEYEGRNMVDAHAHMKLTNREFLAAGSDVAQGMRNAGCGEKEVQELICAFMSLREQVVAPADAR